MRLLSPGGTLRRARRHADLSQRELASKAGMPASVLSRIEAGRQCPTMVTFEKLLKAAGFALQAVSRDGQHIIDTAASHAEHAQTRDGANRCFPAHLDVRKPKLRRPWWYDLHQCARVEPPLLTFDLSRDRRDMWREIDGRTACDPDERCLYPGAQSRVRIPGYRPRSDYRTGGFDD